MGIVEFDLTGTPVLRFDLVDTFGRSVWKTFELPAADLVHGTSSWQRHID